METKQSVSEILANIRQNWPEWDTPETAVMLGIIRLNDLVKERNIRILNGFGLTQAGFEALVTLRAQPKPRRMTPTDLYQAILITSGGMTKVLKQLEEEGDIVREDHSSDKRSRYVRLTPAGEKRAEAVMMAVSEDEKRALHDALSDQQIAQLGKVLLRTLEKLE